MKKNLWILTEERPKLKVIKTILNEFGQDYNCEILDNDLRIIPLLDQYNNFTFTYEVKASVKNNSPSCSQCINVYIKIVSGHSSFVDFLIFYQENEPKQHDEPIYAIEETKTDDQESRNTGVYQRCSKFVFIENYYPNVRKIMLYNLQIAQKEYPTETYIFGTKLLLNLGVKILGKQLDKSIFQPFKSIDDIITFKNNMRRAPAGNVCILLTKTLNKIQISGRLIKSGRLSHDPNIGALTLIASALRKLGWRKCIEITEHGLIQKNVGARNKFVLIANDINISLQGLRIPQATFHDDYWKYEVNGEKLGTIFIHIVVNGFSTGFSIFENHAGCEKGYFITNTKQCIPLAKYKDKEKYKKGDKSQIIFIPDLILVDPTSMEIINIEGKTYDNRYTGITELDNYDYIEEEYIKKYYPKFKITRMVVLYGDMSNKINEPKIGFLLNSKGQLILGPNAPELFKRAINSLLSFYNMQKNNFKQK